MIKKLTAAFAAPTALAIAMGMSPMAVAHAEDVTLTVWSHEADQPAKVALREQAARTVERLHPGVHVKITWYEKNSLYAALRTALPAGDGPDVFYLEPDQADYITSGYILSLDGLVNWATIQPWARSVWDRNGKSWAVPQEVFTNEIYYNKDLLKKLGFKLPANAQFTQEQFLDLVKKARAAGITPIAEGVGDRPFPGAYLLAESLLHKLGPEDYGKLLRGQLSYHDHRVMAVLNWVKQVVDAGAYPKNFLTLKLGETHDYFYGKPGALMFPVSSWFASRAFVPVDKGGMPTDFPLGLMQFPAIDDGACNQCKTSGIGSLFVINAATMHKDVAAEFLNAMSTPEMGERWIQTIYLQTAVKTKDVHLTGPYAGYFAQLMALQKGEKYFIGMPEDILEGRCKDAFAQVMNAAFPGGLLTVDNAATLMDQSCYNKGYSHYSRTYPSAIAVISSVAALLFVALMSRLLLKRGWSEWSDRGLGRFRRRKGNLPAAAGAVPRRPSMNAAMLQLRRMPLLVFVAFYTLLSGGPFLWVAIMSLRTTPEILGRPYALPSTLHWEKFAEAWGGSNYGTYFGNSVIAVVSAVVIVTIIGAMTAHCLARYRFRGARAIRFAILSSMVLPPQLLILSLFQILSGFGLYNSILGLIFVYVASQLGMTVYILEGFFAQIPQDLFDSARMEGYGDLEIFWRITLPIGLPALFTIVTLNFIILWNEFLFAVVFLTDDRKRTLPLGIMHFMGSHQLDIGMVATGLMIAIAPVLILYALFSETMIRGMTAGAMR